MREIRKGQLRHVFNSRDDCMSSTIYRAETGHPAIFGLAEASLLD